jgi:hypothetical protein
MADAIVHVIDHPDEASVIGARAAELAATEYSEDAYMAKTRRACALLFPTTAAQDTA